MSAYEGRHANPYYATVERAVFTTRIGEWMSGRLASLVPKHRKECACS